MEQATYAVEAAIEADHWWFAGRRRLFSREIRRLGLGPDAQILDVGTSTGSNLRMLRDLGFRNVKGLDFSEEAIRFCAEKGLGTVYQGDVCSIPFDAGSFDLVLATDIIEHVDNDGQALHELARVSKPGGSILMTVPAFQQLWGPQDVVAHHKRRYRQAAFNNAVDETGLSVERSYYFNFILFGPIWLARLLLNATGVTPRSENDLNNGFTNAVFGALFHLDCLLAPVVRPPFGVSILTLARRPPHLPKRD